MPSLLITDDHPIVRRGVRDILREAFPTAEIHEAATGRAALKAMAHYRFDIVLLDISLPDESGFDILQEIVHQPDAPRVIMLSVFPEEQYAMRALNAGAMGYLTKETVPDRLVDAISRVLSGRRYISETLAESMVLQRAQAISTPSYGSLSNRELQVLCLIGSGLRSSEVAVRLLLSPKTIATYRARIVEKLGLSTDAAIVRYVLENHLLDPATPSIMEEPDIRRT